MQSYIKLIRKPADNKTKQTNIGSKLITDKNGNSPIDLAISDGNFEIVKGLLEWDPSLALSYHTITGWYPIHTAAYYKQDKILSLLIKYNSDVMTVCTEGSRINYMFKQDYALVGDICHSKVVAVSLDLQSH